MKGDKKTPSESLHMYKFIYPLTPPYLYHHNPLIIWVEREIMGEESNWLLDIPRLTFVHRHTHTYHHVHDHLAISIQSICIYSVREYSFFLSIISNESFCL